MAEQTATAPELAEIGQEAEHHWHPPYWRIFFILLVLTAVEMGLAFFPIVWLAVVLLAIIAIVKIVYIANYFMHLKFDQRILAYIAASPLVFAGFMVFYLLLDYS